MVPAVMPQAFLSSLYAEGAVISASYMVCLPVMSVPGEECFPGFESLIQSADTGSTAQQIQHCHTPRLEPIQRNLSY